MFWWQPKAKISIKDTVNETRREGEFKMEIKVTTCGPLIWWKESTEEVTRQCLTMVDTVIIKINNTPSNKTSEGGEDATKIH